MVKKLLFILLTLAYNFSSCEAAKKDTFEPITPSISAPHIALFDGKKKSNLRDYKGNFVLVNFWATWCPACVSEMASLDSMAAKINRKNFRVLAINLNEGGYSEAQGFVTDLKLKKLIVLYDADSRANKDFLIRGLPTSYLISPDGMMIAKLEGATNWDKDKIISQIEKYIAKSK
jgi:thiol-disulfide isomerase/thioredoxin